MTFWQIQIPDNFQIISLNWKTFPLTLTYNKLIKYTFVNEDETLSFSLCDPSKIWLVQLVLLWIGWLISTRPQLVILIIVLICSLVGFKLLMTRPSLCCTMTLLLLVKLVYLVYFRRFLFLTLPNVLTRPLIKLVMAKHLEPVDHIYNFTEKIL